MALSVELEKRLGSFCLETQFEMGNETLALLGASGSGKSVTLRCVAGILKPDRGKIVLDGRTLFDSAAGIHLPPQQRGVGYLFQQYALFPHMTVRENIEIAVPECKNRRRDAAEKLRQFQLEDVAEQKPWQISGGQQQRTALARILASRPQAILLDEPFSALDSHLKDQLELELAQTLDQFDKSVIWVSHDRGEVFRNCQRVCVMDGGRAQPVSTLDELLHSPGTDAAARLSGCQNCIPAIPRGAEVVVPDWGRTLCCGREVEQQVRWVGLRAHHIHPAEQTEENAFACDVVRVMYDACSTIVLLRPEGAKENAPLLRMELDGENHDGIHGQERIWVAVAPENILLLRSGR